MQPRRQGLLAPCLMLAPARWQIDQPLPIDRFTMPDRSDHYLYRHLLSPIYRSATTLTCSSSCVAIPFVLFRGRSSCSVHIEPNSSKHTGDALSLIKLGANTTLRSIPLIWARKVLCHRRIIKRLRARNCNLSCRNHATSTQRETAGTAHPSASCFTDTPEYGRHEKQ
jgi:hypothetical protein